MKRTMTNTSTANEAVDRLRRLGRITDRAAAAKLTDALHDRVKANRATIGQSTYVFVDDDNDVYTVPSGGMVLGWCLKQPQLSLLAVLDPTRPTYSKRLAESVLTGEA